MSLKEFFLNMILGILCCGSSVLSILLGINYLKECIDDVY